MANAKQLPSGNWRVRPTYTDEDGVTHTISITEKTEKLANAKALAWQSGLIRDLASRKNLVLETAIEEYIETCRRIGLSPATITAYGVCKRNAYPLLLRKQVSRITLRDIQRQIDERSMVVSPKTIANEVNLLSEVLKQHRRDLDFSILKRPRRTASEMIIPDDDQARLLINTAKRDPALYCAVLIACVTGMRRGEICALEWKDLNAAKRTITVNKTLVKDEHGTYQLKPPKTQSGVRTIVVEASVFDELNANRANFRRVVPLTPDQVTSRFIKMRDELGLEDIRFHNLRHYHASVLLCLGVPLTVAKKMLGHKTENMIQQVYGHLVSGAKSEIEERVSGHTSALLKGEKITYLPHALPRAEEN